MINTPGSTPVGKRQMSISDVLLPPFLCHSPVPSLTETCWISHLHRSMNVRPLPEELGQSSQSETWSQTDTAFRGMLEGTVDGHRQTSGMEVALGPALSSHTLRASQLLSGFCPISLVHGLVTHPVFYRPDLLKSQSGGLTNYPRRVLPPSHLMGPAGCGWTTLRCGVSRSRQRLPAGTEQPGLNLCAGHTGGSGFSDWKSSAPMAPCPRGLTCCVTIVSGPF